MTQRNATKEINASEAAKELAQWVVERHNFIVDSSNQNLEPETLIPLLMEQKEKVRGILLNCGDNGILDDVLNHAIYELDAKRGQLHVLSEEQARAIDADTWTPDSGFLPEPFDLTLGDENNKKRYVSLGDGRWAKIPLDMTPEQLQRLRDKVQENLAEEGGEQQVSVGETSEDEAYRHAQRCMFEALSLHLSRFALRMDDDEEDQQISMLGPTARRSNDGSPVSHELVGVVVSGTTELAALSSPSFINMLATYVDADPKATQLVGATQLRNAFPLIGSPQSLLDMSNLIAKKLEQGKPAVDKNDLEFQEIRDRLGLDAAETFEDVEDHSLVVFSVVRRNPEIQAVWIQGGVDLVEDQDDEAHASWVMMAEGWLDKHHLMSTYILPPCPLFEAVSRLGASFLATIGQGNGAVVAALGHDGKVQAISMIDVVAFDSNERPQARAQIPAWVFGLIESSVGQAAEELFDFEMSVLPSDHGLNLDDIPQLTSVEDEDEGVGPLQKHNPKRTLH